MSQTELDSMAAVSQYHRQQEAGMCQVRPHTVHLFNFRLLRGSVQFYNSHEALTFINELPNC